MEFGEIHTPVAVLGGGPAGYVAAIRLAQLGSEVVLIEEEALGGVCMNQGCIPTKALLHSSGAVTSMTHHAEIGVAAELVGVCWDVAIARKNRIVKNLHTGLQQLMEAKKIKVLHGRGEVRSEKELVVHTEDGKTIVIFDKLILATGSEAIIPAIPGVDLVGVVTSKEALELAQIPKTAVVIGAGVVGLEFATMLRGAGCKTTVIDMVDRLLPEEDEDISAELLKLLKRQGIAFKLGAYIDKIEKNGDTLAVHYQIGEKTLVAEGEIVLLATGRKPRANVGLPFIMNGNAIAVNEYLETSVKGIYAAGDVVGGQLLAHLAYAQGRVAAENAMGMNAHINYNAVPSCIYTTPEYAKVGLNEQLAKAKGIPVRVGKFYFRANGRAQTLDKRDGFVKIVAGEDGIILGAQILGADASELISELTLAVTVGANAALLADMIHPHPTLSEAVWEACGAVLGRSLHGI